MELEKIIPFFLHNREKEYYLSYADLLKFWNTKINLISRKSITELFERHFLDSVFISDISYKYLEDRPVYDIGSGAGFPGIIFAIRYPEINITLYERTKKKKNFLSNVIHELKLRNVLIKEEFGVEKIFGFFLNRAFIKREKIVSYFLRHSKIKSRFIVCSGEKESSLVLVRNVIKITDETYFLSDLLGKRRVEIFEICST